MIPRFSYPLATMIGEQRRILEETRNLVSESLKLGVQGDQCPALQAKAAAGAVADAFSVLPTVTGEDFGTLSLAYGALRATQAMSGGVPWFRLL